MVFLALAKGVITALCLIKPLIYLNKEEAKCLTTVESTLLIGGERLWPACRGLSPSQVQLVPRGRLPGCEVLRRVSQSSESNRRCPKVAAWLRGLSFRAHGCPLR